MSDPLPVLSCQSVGGTTCGLIRAAPQSILILDGKRRILALNASAEHLFGYVSAQVLGSAIESLLVHETKIQDVINEFETAGFDRPHEIAVCRGRRRNGTTFPMRMNIVHIPPAANLADAYYAAFVQDLSTESALETEVQMLQQRLHTMVELAPVGIWVVADDRVQMANRAAARMVGVESGEALVGKSIYSLLRIESHAEMRRQMKRALMHPQALARLPARVSRHDGQYCHVEIALASLPDHGQETVQMVINDVSQCNREAQELERSRRMLRRMSANAVDAREEERRRIARELHDELGQSLSALKMEIADCARTNLSGFETPRVSSILGHVDEIVNSVRRIAANLRPLMLDDLGLAEAIESLVSEFSRRHGIDAELNIEPIEPPVDQKIAIALYRVVQEALNNVARHAQANKVSIGLARYGGELVLRVEDNGIGLPELATLRDSQFGLLGMEERAGMLGGRLELVNTTDGGARIIVRVPLKQKPPRDPTPRAI